MSGGATLHHVDEPFALVLATTLQATPSMSYRAKGVLATLLSYPTGWRFSMKHLQGLATEGRDALRAAMRELRAHGYVKYEREVDEKTGQQKGTRVYVSRAPKEDWMSDRQPENPGDGFPGAREPVAIRSTEERSTTEAKASVSAPEPKQGKRREEKQGRARKPNPHGILIGEAIGIWNQERHPAWPELKKMTGRGAKYLKEFLAYFDGDPERASSELAAAIRYAVKHEDWWRDQRSITFDQLAAKNKLEGYADKARARGREQGENAEQGVGRGETPQDPLLGSLVRSKAGWLAILKDKKLNRYWAEYQEDQAPSDGWLYDHDIEEVVQSAEA